MGHDDIKTVAVNADVDIDGVDNFVPTYVEVKRSVSASGEAKVKGLLDNPDALRQGSNVEIYVRSQESGGKIFHGELYRATVNREGVYTIEAYDVMTQLHNMLVQLNTDRPRYANEVARDLIEEGTQLAVAGKSANPDNLPPFSAYVAPGRAFPGGDVAENRTYGSAKQGEPLYRVLMDLTDKLGGVLWVDRNNVLRLEPWPSSKSYEVPYIIDLNSGSDTVNKKRVVVQGGAPVGQLGQGAYSMYSRFSPSSRANYGEEPQPPEKTIEDQNVTTQRGADKLAMSEQFDQGMQQNNGKVKVVGNPEVELFDRIKIPELEEKIPSTIQNGTLVRKLRDPNYSVGGVTHVVSGSDGYTTTMQIRPDPTDVLQNLAGGVTGAMANGFTDKIDNKTQDNGILSFFPGFE